MNISGTIADMSFKRILELPDLLKKKSFFLFGPRSTGKSYLIREQLAGKIFLVDLLQSHYYLELSANPNALESMVDANLPHPPLVVIDEIQKVPALLNEVHRLIESKKWRFLLTGSSARQLKRKDANLLGGRAWQAHLHPLCWPEIPGFNLDRYLRYGGLPHVYPSENPDEELHAYVNIYLKEEILSEGLIRKLPPFSRFLKTAALSNGHVLNFTEVGNDAQVSPSTIREYYAILSDTLMGFMLEPWIASRKRKAVQTAKFYFFDTGVAHALAGAQALERNSDLYGVSFEQFIGMELRAYLDYRRIKKDLTFWRTLSGFEVDYLVGDHTAIEIKATGKISEKHFKGLRALAEEKIIKQMFLVSQDQIATKKDGIHALPWQQFLKKLWTDEIKFL